MLFVSLVPNLYTLQDTRHIRSFMTQNQRTDKKITSSVKKCLMKLADFILIPSDKCGLYTFQTRPNAFMKRSRKFLKFW